MITYLSKKRNGAFEEDWFEIFDKNNFWMVWRLLAFLGQIDALGFSRDRSLRGLEVGCGRGVLRESLESASGWTVDGADLDESALNANVDCVGDTFYYDVHDRSERFHEYYDFIILFDVLEHIENEREFLNSVLFHLKKGGHLFINVPALQMSHSKYDNAVGHLRRYNKRSLKTVVENAGLHVEDIRYWGLSMTPLLFARKIMLKTRNYRHSEIIEKGAKPRGKLFDMAIRAIMRVELALFKSPPLGTSVLLAASNPKVS